MKTIIYIINSSKLIRLCEDLDDVDDTKDSAFSNFRIESNLWILIQDGFDYLRKKKARRKKLNFCL